MRKRLNDIPLLGHHFLDKFAERNRKQVKGFTPLSMDMLLKYEWPRNVRGLENTVERAAIPLPEDYVTEKELPLSITQSYQGNRPLAAFNNSMAESQSLEEIEKAAILAALEASGGNKSKTARRLEVNRKTLHKKLKSYGVT